VKIATKSDWRHEPLPQSRRPLDYARRLTPLQAERAKQGYVPAVMEDRWFMVFDEGHLLFYRSWTGFCMFGVTLNALPDGSVDLENPWASIDTEQSPYSANFDLALYDFERLVETLISDDFQRYKETGPFG
jgi:hypothetical protein